MHVCVCVCAHLFFLFFFLESVRIGGGVGRGGDGGEDEISVTACKLSLNPVSKHYHISDFYLCTLHACCFVTTHYDGRLKIASGCKRPV